MTSSVRRVVVTGGRHYADADAAFAALDWVWFGLVRRGVRLEIAHGGASGADELAGVWAPARFVRCQVFPADWHRYGAAAGPIRNGEMVRAFRPHALLVFPGGAGTANCVKHGREFGAVIVDALTRGALPPLLIARTRSCGGRCHARPYERDHRVSRHVRLARAT